jgi:hypothetical protein
MSPSGHPGTTPATSQPSGSTSSSTLPGTSTTLGSTGTTSVSPGASFTQSPIAQQMKSDLEKSGFKNVRIMPESFLVRAEDPQGHPVMMVVNPDSVTAITALGVSGSGSSSTGGTSSSMGSTGTAGSTGAGSSGTAHMGGGPAANPSGSIR